MAYCDHCVHCLPFLPTKHVVHDDAVDSGHNQQMEKQLVASVNPWHVHVVVMNHN